MIERLATSLCYAPRVRSLVLILGLGLGDPGTPASDSTSADPQGAAAVDSPGQAPVELLAPVDAGRRLPPPPPPRGRGMMFGGIALAGFGLGAASLGAFLGADPENSRLGPWGYASIGVGLTSIGLGATTFVYGLRRVRTFNHWHDAYGRPDVPAHGGGLGFVGLIAIGTGGLLLAASYELDRHADVVGARWLFAPGIIAMVGGAAVGTVGATEFARYRRWEKSYGLGRVEDTRFGLLPLRRGVGLSFSGRI